MKKDLLLALLLMMGTCGCNAQSRAPRQQLHGTFIVPRATGDHPKPIWIANPYWDQYKMPGFWQCPIGYVQEFGNSAMSPSKHGEMSGGSEDHSKEPTCRMPKKGEFE